MRLFLIIFAAIVCAVLALGVMLEASAYFAQRQAVADLHAQFVASEHNAAERKSEDEKRRRAYQHSLLLGKNEICQAGTVVRVSATNGVVAYDQVLINSRPVRCAGRSRLQ